MKTNNRNESTRATRGIEVNGLDLHPVSANATGEGLPYAPIDWPNPGDNWRWKAGRRTNTSGYYLHRYLYTPKTFETRKTMMKTFSSKLSAKNYVQREFPGTDVKTFFASFSWNIPSMNVNSVKGDEEMAENYQPNSPPDIITCKVGNKMCNSLIVNWEESCMPCDICCSEPGFCRGCCCILCCKTINAAYGDYSYIKCEAKESNGNICAHMAHINCALRTSLAGTVEGNLGLDAEYHCRRCDARTNLVKHVRNSIHACKSIDSRDDIKKILEAGICILQNSERETSKWLLSRIELAISKVKSEIYIEDIWKVEDDMAAIFSGASNDGKDSLEEVTRYHDPMHLKAHSHQKKSASSYTETQSLKLENDIHNILQSLKKSQEAEYETAEKVLNTQKSHLLQLYEKLHEERSELSTHTSSVAPDSLLEAILTRLNQIKAERNKLETMEEVAKGFGNTSKGILKEHFGLEFDS